MNFPKFRDYDDSKRKKKYGWDFNWRNKRLRPTFATKKEKQEYFDAFEKKFNGERNALVDFNPDLYREYHEQSKRLEGKATITEVVDYWLGNNRFPHGLMLSEAREEMLKDERRIRNTGYTHIELHTGLLLDYIGDKPVNDIVHDEIQDFFDKLLLGGEIREEEVSPVTATNYLKHIRKLFKREIDAGRLGVNPARLIKLPKKKKGARKESGIMSVDDIKTLLYWCEENDPSLAGLLAILFFTGLRSSVLAPDKDKQQEDGQLTKDMILEDRKIIKIPAELMKTEHPHIIQGVPECLWSWVQLIDEKDLTMCTSSFTTRKDRARVLAVAGPKPNFKDHRKAPKHLDKIHWPSNAARHSFASYYSVYKKTNEGTAEIMAQETTSVFLKHYKESVTYEDAVIYCEEIWPKFTTEYKRLKERDRQRKKRAKKSKGKSD